MENRIDLGIPYGIADFKRIRTEGYYYVDKSEYLAKAEDGIAKLRRYAADPFVPELAKDTTLHLILYQFKGTELVRLEEIAQ